MTNTEGLFNKHRARMAAQVEQQGFEGLSDGAVLEYLLFFARPRVDTAVPARALLKRFGSFAGVLEASPEELAQVEGVGAVSARLLHAVLLASRRYAQSAQAPAVSLTKPEAAIRYVQPLFVGLVQERSYLITLDGRGRPGRTVLLAEGAPGSVALPVQKLARETVASGCTLALLAHNHPHGLAAPSPEDIQATGRAARALGILGITLLDHIIAADGEAVSLTRTGRLPHYDPVSGEVEYPS